MTLNSKTKLQRLGIFKISKRLNATSDQGELKMASRKFSLLFSTVAASAFILASPPVLANGDATSPNKEDAVQNTESERERLAEEVAAKVDKESVEFPLVRTLPEEAAARVQHC